MLSVVTSGYQQGRQTVGMIGVIGPTRIAYDRVIPVVDMTARVLSLALSLPATKTCKKSKSLAMQSTTARVKNQCRLSMV